MHVILGAGAFRYPKSGNVNPPPVSQWAGSLLFAVAAHLVLG